jgi:hypothetical protein
MIGRAIISILTKTKGVRSRHTLVPDGFSRSLDLRSGGLDNILNEAPTLPRDKSIRPIRRLWCVRLSREDSGFDDEMT